MKYWLLIILNLSVRVAGACDCSNPSMQKAYQLADYVVQGRVIYGGFGSPLVLRISREFKGRLHAKQVTLINVPLDCKFYFGLSDYVVFLNNYKAGYIASPCQKHFPLTDTVSLKAFQLVSRGK